MEPFDRFKKLNTEGNLWIYILSLGKEEPVCDHEIRKLIFEKFGFLPSNILLKTVLFKLRRGGFIATEKLKGKRAYKTTLEGLNELEKMKKFCQELIDKV